jgi:hypothetical protein
MSSHSETEIDIFLTLQSIAITSLACFTVYFIRFQYAFRKRSGNQKSMFRNKFVVLSLAIAICLIISECSYASYLSFVLRGNTQMNNWLQIEWRFFVTTVFDISAMYCHIALLYIRMMALVKAGTHSESIRAVAIVLVTLCALFGTSGILVYFLRFVGYEMYRDQLNFWFNLLTTVYGACLVLMDILSTACFLLFLNESEQVMKNQKLTSSQSTGTIASMGVRICVTSLTGTAFYGSAAFTTDVFQREWLKLVMCFSIVLVSIFWMTMKIRLDLEQEERANTKSSNLEGYRSRTQSTMKRSTALNRSTQHIQKPTLDPAMSPSLSQSLLDGSGELNASS